MNKNSKSQIDVQNLKLVGFEIFNNFGSVTN